MVDERDESDQRGSLDSCQDALDRIGRPTAVHVDPEHTECPDSTADKQTKVQPNADRQLQTQRVEPACIALAARRGRTRTRTSPLPLITSHAPTVDPANKNQNFQQQKSLRTNDKSSGSNDGRKQHTETHKCIQNLCTQTPSFQQKSPNNAERKNVTGSHSGASTLRL